MTTLFERHTPTNAPQRAEDSHAKRAHVEDGSAEFTAAERGARRAHAPSRVRRLGTLSRWLGISGLCVLSSSAWSCSASPGSGGQTSSTGGARSGAGGAGGASSASGGTSVGIQSGGSSTIGLPSGGSGVVIPTAGNAGMPPDGSCAATSTSAELVPLDLYVLVDSSKSMNEQTPAGPSKWQSLTDAMSAFFNDANSAGLGIALKYFPDEQPTAPATCTADADCGAFAPCDQRKACVQKDTFTKTVTTLCSVDTDCAANEVCVPVQHCADGPNCAKVYCASGGATTPCPADCVPFDGYCRSRDVCTAANYATPAVPFGTLPDAAPALLASFAARTPGGYTPTGPALSGALQGAADRARANPNHKVAVVLVTDGLPGGFIPNAPPAECTPGDIAGIASMLSSAATTSPSIPTFVIGVFGPCDLVDLNVMPQQNLDVLASSGNTGKAVLINTDQNVSQQLQDALKQVRTSAIACQYTIPQSNDLDFGKVNVNFVSGGNKTTIGYVGSKDKCDPTLGGWYYDVDPATGGTPTEIIACDQSCSTFQSITDARVDIALGCATIVIK